MASVLSLGDSARSRICSFSHRTKHGGFTKESSPSNLAMGGSVCSRKWLSGQCGTPCKTVKDSSLEHRWARQVAEIVFRCNHGSAPSALKDKLRRNNHGARTRGSKESYLPYRPSSLSGELSFSNRAPLMWNTLPRAMQQVSSRTSFKKLYLELLTSKSQSSNTVDLAINHRLIKCTCFSFFLLLLFFFPPSPLIYFIFLIVGTLEKTICLLEILL